jgi:hypothetical protein
MGLFLSTFWTPPPATLPMHWLHTMKHPPNVAHAQEINKLSVSQKFQTRREAYNKMCTEDAHTAQAAKLGSRCGPDTPLSAFPSLMPHDVHERRHEHGQEYYTRHDPHDDDPRSGA